jgi:hypothetical protein
MCAGIEYLRDGERVAVYFDSNAPDLPVRQRGGAVRFYRWAARSAQYFSPDNPGGYAAKFPETCCARLADIRAGKWTSLAPQPVRIVASRIIQLDRVIGPVYFALEAGEFMHGLLASIGSHERVYVVAIPTAAEYVERWPASR